MAKFEAPIIESKWLRATQLGKWIVCEQLLTILMPPTSGFNPKLSLSESPLTLLRNSSKRNGKRVQEEM